MLKTYFYPGPQGFKNMVISITHFIRLIMLIFFRNVYNFLSKNFHVTSLIIHTLLQYKFCYIRDAFQSITLKRKISRKHVKHFSRWNPRTVGGNSIPGLFFRLGGYSILLTLYIGEIICWCAFPSCRKFYPGTNLRGKAYARTPKKIPFNAVLGNQIDSLIIQCFISSSRTWNVTIISEGLQNLDQCSALRVFNRRGSLSCHTWCDTGPWFFQSHPKNHPIQSTPVMYKGGGRRRTYSKF
jgi:hypothetical protein